VYRLGNLADGAWTIRVEMVGFFAAQRKRHDSAPAPPTFALKLLPLPRSRPGLPPPVVETPQAPPTPSTGARAPHARDSAGAPPVGAGSGFQRAAVSASAGTAAAADGNSPEAMRAIAR
jgi:hypothetical protein